MSSRACQTFKCVKMFLLPLNNEVIINHFNQSSVELQVPLGLFQSESSAFLRTFLADLIQTLYLVLQFSFFFPKMSWTL